MEDGVAAAHGAGDRVEIAHVAGDDFHLRAARAPVEPSRSPERVVVDEGPDGVAALERALDQM